MPSNSPAKHQMFDPLMGLDVGHTEVMVSVSGLTHPHPRSQG
jgi:hypothetical protein